MASTQYIGARYVPLLYTNPNDNSNSWLAGVAYDPLTIVTDLNQSYTSKIPVPASVGRPSENPTYWVLTGSYNAQVEEYRQEVETLSDTVEDIDERTRIYNNIIMIGDSYGHASGSNAGWIDKLSAKMNISPANLFDVAGSGSGFTPGSGVGGFNELFNNLIATMSADEIENVGMIIVAGGANDVGQSADALTGYVKAAVTNMKNTCPNAKIYVGFISAVIANDYACAQQPRILQAYRSASTVDRVYYMNNVEYCMHSHDNINSDGIHPTDTGYQIITDAMYAALKNSFNYTYYNPNVVVTAPTGATAGSNTFVIDINNEKAQITNTLPLDIQFSTPVNFSIGAIVTLGQLSSKAILGTTDSNYGYNRTATQIHAFVYNSNDTFMWNTLCDLWIDNDGALKLRNRDYERTSASTGYSSVKRIFIVTKFQISAPSNGC